MQIGVCITKIDSKRGILNLSRRGIKRQILVSVRHGASLDRYLQPNIPKWANAEIFLIVNLASKKAKT